MCDYLGETPPGHEPQVFGRGVVSVDGKNTHALRFSPDGRMLVFSRYPDGTSFRNPVPRINRDAMAVLCPTVSPDGKYLFFTRVLEGGTGLLYRVSTGLTRPRSASGQFSH